MVKKPSLILKNVIENMLGEDPLKINDLPLATVPDYMRKKGGFWYWTGAVASMAFVYQVVTGLLLLLYYNPANAYISTEYILNNVPYGEILLTTHLYGAYAMIVVIYIHMFRNYFIGAYKKPRQLQWITGLILLALTIGVGYFGYSMTGDVLSADATDVGRGIALSVPVLGNISEAIMFGNGTNTSLFIRMLGWHIILAALVGALFGFHFYLAEANGIMPNQRSAKYTAPAVEKDKPEHKAWFPYNLLFLMQLGAFAFGIFILLPSLVDGLQVLNLGVPAIFDPFPQVSPSSPLASFVPPYPPWFLLFVYKAVDFTMFNAFGGYSALVASIWFGGLPLIYFLLVPFIDRSNNLHPLSRSIFTAFGVIAIIYLILLSAWGVLAPGIPINTTDVTYVLLPPFIIVIAFFLLLGHFYKKGAFTPSISKISTSFALFMILLIVGIFEMAIQFSSIMNGLNASNISQLGIFGSATAFAAFGTMKSSDIANLARVDEKPVKGISISLNAAKVFVSILFIISAEILWLMIQANPLNLVQEAAFGVGLGVLLIIVGIGIRIYRLAYYYE
ncbi:MAG: cytochrome bc complex cytochrome b subunit [Candidatus Thermoplasmatota archaeon]|jgi:quinol-cytochrome oxidoreductase complex cytochrome b subunit|nr:cytochrome bc complex cytochrome b subunit [Candidatus Thermoplasmatota archaeon]MCL5987715.1 cytochrome bc complex cytochrome b subunit [Candidatus Thermoplasmatota archaeon]